MGRDWYVNWGSKSYKKRGKTGGNGGDGGGGRRDNQPATVVAEAAAAAGGGCMNAVLHLFDFHHLQLCLHPLDSPAVQPTSSSSPFLPHYKPTPFKVNSGVEAPRNSLESLEEMVITPPSLASLIKGEKDESSRIPASRRDTKLKLVKAPRGKTEELSSESSCSPASVRTPTLVARLMGLDILPESNTTTPRSSNCQPLQSPHLSSLSTPPISRTRKTRIRSSYDNSFSAEASKSSSLKMRNTMTTSTDVVDEHRFSLQINKENSIVKEMELSRPSCSAMISTKRREGKSYEEEYCRSPGYYTRQIMKQVRETVSRKVGIDITNVVGESERELRRDEHLLTIITRKKKSNKKETSPGKNLAVHLSDSTVLEPSATKLSFNMETQLRAENEEEISEPVEMVLETVKLQSKATENEEEKKQLYEQQHCSNKLEQNLKKFDAKSWSKKKTSLESIDAIRNKKEEQFVRSMKTNKRCMKAPLSSDLLHGSLVPLNRNPPSLRTTKLFDKEGLSSKVQPLKSSTTNATPQLPRILSQRYDRVHEEASQITPATQTENSRKNSNSLADHFQYITRILKSTGITNYNTPISFTKWFSPSHPLNPSIFQNLETGHYLTSDSISSPCDHQLSFATNRKLIFHLVDEILADTLKPSLKFKSWVLFSTSKKDCHHHYEQQGQMNGFQLVKTLCTKIRNFPAANCQTLEDIDALVEKDFPRIGAENDVSFEEEGETIVSQIEGDIVDSLVQEFALLCLTWPPQLHAKILTKMDKFSYAIRGFC